MPNEEIKNIELDKLESFKNHPYKVLDETLDELVESVKQNGVQEPLIVRKKPNDKYEIISGHRRKRACELSSIDLVPCIIREYTDVEAIIKMVDSNIKREQILPSEKAFAYKMKFEALKEQGKRNDLTSCQVGTKLRNDEKVSDSESARQVQRYIRLTYLIPELLRMVDEKKIAFNPAVELSYLNLDEQKKVLETIKCFEATPSLSQALKLKKISKESNLTSEIMDNILSEEKGNQIPKYQISYTKFANYIPQEIVTPKEVEDYLLKCVAFCKKQGIDINKMELSKGKIRER